jgi:polysaccharide export outer membrane protein
MKKASFKLFVLFLLLSMASCVPNKKVAYLQYKSEYAEPENIVMDSLIRMYKTEKYSYKLQRGDLIDIKISTMTPIIYNPFADADRSLIPGQQITQATDPERQAQITGYYVEGDGFVNLPIVGKIRLEGSSLVQAEDSIEVYVKKYLEKPVVRIKLQNFRFSIMGEVEREATLTSGDSYLTLLQAIALAGGPSEFGDMSRVKVLRRMGDETYVFYANLLDEEYLSSPFYFIQPNDVIVLMALKQRSYLKYLSPNLGLITATTSLLISILTLITIL